MAATGAHEDRPHEPRRHGVRMQLGRVPGKDTEATGTLPDGTTPGPSDAVAAGMPALWALIQGTAAALPAPLSARPGAPDGSAVAAVPAAVPMAALPTAVPIGEIASLGTATSGVGAALAVGSAPAAVGQQDQAELTTVAPAATAPVPTAPVPTAPVATATVPTQPVSAAPVPTAAAPATLPSSAALTEVLGSAASVSVTQPPTTPPQASAPDLLPALGPASVAPAALPQPDPLASAVPPAGGGEPGPTAATPPSTAEQVLVASTVDVSAAPTPGTASGPPTREAVVSGLLDELGRRSAENDGGATGPDPSALLTAPAPAAPTAAPPAAVAAPPPAQPLATQVAQHLTVFRGGPDGRHSITVVLNPDQLGPVQVEVTLSRGTLDLTLRGAHATGREALLAALPELRRDLESAGLSCSRLDVDADTGGSWSAQHRAPEQQGAGSPPDHRGAGGGRGQEGRGERGRPAWAGPVHLGGGRPAPASGRSTLAGVDVRV